MNYIKKLTTVSLTEDQLNKINQMKEDGIIRFDGKYSSTAHFIRCAINKLLREPK